MNIHVPKVAAQTSTSAKKNLKASMSAGQNSCTQTETPSSSALHKTALENADELIVQKALKKYEPFMIKDPVTGELTSKTILGNKEWMKRERENNKDFIAAMKNEIKKHKKSRWIKNLCGFFVPQQYKKTDKVKETLTTVLQDEVEGQAKREALYTTIRNDAAKTIQNAWKNRKPLTPERKAQIQAESRALKAQHEQLHKTGTIDYSEKLKDGLLLNSSLDSHLNTERIVVDRRNDPVLNRFLNSKEVNGLRTDLQSLSDLQNIMADLVNLPNQDAKRQYVKQHIAKEKQYLHQAMDKVVNHNYGKVNREDLETFYNQFKEKKLRYDLEGIKVPLGSTIEGGAGLCRHRSATAKVMFDEIGLPSTLNYGCFNGDGHAWNTVKMPSGKEYLFDPMQNCIIDLFLERTRAVVKNNYKTLGEMPLED